MAGRARRRGPVGRLWKRVRTALVLALGPGLVAWLVRIILRTSAVEIVNWDALAGLWDRGERVIIAFWHGRMLMLPPVLPRERKLGVLISQHRDGELIARVLDRFGIDSVRGSATRGGVRALREMKRRIGDGWDLAITPDGPRGPAFQVKKGVVDFARLVDASIVPITYSASRGLKMRSWDRFLLPLPCGRIAYVVGDPIRVHLDGSGCQALDEAGARLSSELDRITALADERVGGGPHLRGPLGSEAKSGAAKHGSQPCA